MAGENSNNLSNNNKDVPEDILNGFRSKASFMKTWKPASNPSNRDRLELYSLHKQAVSGDAPTSTNGTNIDVSSPAEKAKYNAWKSKMGIETKEAMRRYIIECDRQIQMYGTQPQHSQSQQLQSQQQLPRSTNSNGAMNAMVGVNNPTTNRIMHQQQQHHSSGNANHRAYQMATATAAATTLRGLAAIPLLCAAASEDRQAYIRRLQNTPRSSASFYSSSRKNDTSTTTAALSWWRRQEPLTATPGSIGAIPEHILLFLASFIEYISLSVNAWNHITTTGSSDTNSSIDTSTMNDASPAVDDGDELLSNTNTNQMNNSNSLKNLFMIFMPPSAVIQSFFWPLHNCLLATWIEIILLHAIITGAFDCFWTVLWGSKTTGKTLPSVWNQHIRLATIQSMNTITDYHQPLSTRCIGLLLWPSHLLVQTISIITIDDDQSTMNGTNIPSLNRNTAAPSYPSSAAGNSNQVLNANIWTCLFYSTAITFTWWYWIAVVPWITMVALIVIFWVGGTCFALIELASV